jgi:hypothetical protein
MFPRTGAMTCRSLAAPPEESAAAPMPPTPSWKELCATNTEEGCEGDLSDVVVSTIASAESWVPARVYFRDTDDLMLAMADRLIGISVAGYEPGLDHSYPATG